MSRLFILLLCFFSSFTFATEWERLFEHPKYQFVKISPNGENLAVAMDTDGKRSLAFIERKTMKYLGGVKLPGKNEVGTFYWANDERIVIKVNQREPWRKEPLYYGELYAVNIDGTQGEMIYGYRSYNKMSATSGGSKFKKKEQIRGWADVIDLLPADEEHILISSTPWDIQGDRLAAVYKLNIYTGKIRRKHIAGSPIPYARFLTNNQGEIKVVVGTDKNYKGQVFIRENKKWHPVPKTSVGSDFYPLTLTEDGSSLYALDNFKQDKIGLVKFDLEKGTSKTVYSDVAVDITNVEYSSDGNSIYALRVDEHFPAYLLLNQEHQEAQIFKGLVAAFPDQVVNITSQSKDGRYSIVMVTSDVQAGKFFLYDNKENKLSALFSYYPEIKTQALARKEPFSFAASDGLPISGYFTQAKQQNENEISPLVVLVHGGPHARDYWSFSSEVQFLALNGFSVLQVNFRGSSGYGKGFEEKGYLNWGTRIQDDIKEAYEWAINEGLAEQNNACIMGTSFGAYSAIQSASRYPNLYQCAIANAGIYDLELMYEEGDVPKFAFGKSYLKKTIGTDKKQLKENSPVHNIDSIKVPLLIAHGKQDRRAPFEQAERLKKALDDSNKKYQWYTVADESHGFFVPENQKKYMNKVVEFLGSHIGD